MNSNDKQTLERAIRTARPADITMQSVSSIGGATAIREALKAIEADATRYQRSGSEVLLVVLKR